MHNLEAFISHMFDETVVNNYRMWGRGGGDCWFGWDSQLGHRLRSQLWNRRQKHKHKKARHKDWEMETLGHLYKHKLFVVYLNGMNREDKLSFN